MSWSCGLVDVLSMGLLMTLGLRSSLMHGERKLTVLTWSHRINPKTKELVVGASEGIMLDIEKFDTQVSGMV